MSVAQPSQVELMARPVGISLKPDHYTEIVSMRPGVSFFEVHAENYMMPSGPHHRYLDAITDQYALSLHGVGLSLGSAGGIDEDHLARFKALVDRYDPDLVSEHLAWSVEGGHYLNDLLPLPLNDESLAVVADNIHRVQDAIGRPILVENPSSYLAFEATTMGEVEFLSKIADRTGCGLLLDVNNVVVSAHNMGWSATDYIDSFPAAYVGEVHLAGHLVKQVNDKTIRIDDHGSPVGDEVWSLYASLIRRIGTVPTLVEWDNDIPALDVLIGEAEKARRHMDSALTPNDALHV